MVTHSNAGDRSPSLRRDTALTPHEINRRARAAAADIVREGEADNTRRSYASALRYWCAWAEARYGQALPFPVPVATVVQFIVDHTARNHEDQLVHELPEAIDQKLVRSRVKAALGPLKLSTVTHRIAALSKLHQLRELKPNPCEDPSVRHLLSQARRAAAKRGERPRQQNAATKAPLTAMIATCDDSLQGIRDRAILYFAWSSGGRRRSEVAQATIEQLTPTDEGYLFDLYRSKSNQDGRASIPKPIRGQAAQALATWLNASSIEDGPIFRRLWRERVGPALSPAAIGDVVKRRARQAGLDGRWAGHSLRAGFITEAGKQGLALGDVMAMTEQRRVDTVLGYYRAGELASASISDLLESS